MSNNYDEHSIQSGSSHVGVQPQGGYVSSWNDILYVGSVLKRSGIPILFPHFGKSEQYRMHGFGRDSLWKVTDQSEHGLTMELTSEMLDEKSKLEYPHTFTAQIQLQLHEDSLVYGLAVENKGSTSLPLTPGLHPYWSIDHTQKKSLRIDGITGFDAQKIDWDQSPPDNIYDFSGKAVVEFPDKTLTIEEITEGEKQVRHLVVWSQTPIRDPDYNFVCVEPVCGVNYQIEKDPILVQPESTWRMKLQFSVQKH